MGELRDAVTGRHWRRIGGVAFVAAAVSLGCDLVPVPPSPAASGAASPSAVATGTPADSVPSGPPTSPPDPIMAAEGRLVWLVDAGGRAGLWTTDLAGGDPVTYIAGLDEGTTTIRDPLIVGDAVVFIADRPGASELRVVLPGSPAGLLLDRVVAVQPDGPDSVIATRDEGSTRQVVRIRVGGAAPERLLEVPIPADAAAAGGPFGVAISPDGRTVAAGWVGATVTIDGPFPSTLDDVGAPLVVGDDGVLAAVTGRAGEAYLVVAGQLTELAPPDSDPLTLPGTGFVAWPALDGADTLDAIEVRDVLAGLSRTYPVGGSADGIREFTPDHILLEATAFDPRQRTVGYLDLDDGRFGTFAAGAPTIEP